MKKSPFRPEPILLPFSLALIALLGNPEAAALIFTVFTVLQVITLNAPGAYRNAAASEPGMRRVDARFLGALLQGIAGTIVLLILKLIKIIPAAVPAEICIASGALLIERIFEERLYAVSRRPDAFLLAFVTFILLTAGTLIGSAWAGSMAALAVAVIVTLVNQPVKYRKIMMNWAYIPRSLIRDLPCPIILCAGMNFLSIAPLCVFAGWAVNTCCGTFARCSSDETRRPRFFVCLSVFAACILKLILPGFSPVSAVSIAAVISILTVFSMDIRSIISAVLCIAVCILTFAGFHAAAIAVSAAAFIVSFDKRMFLKKV